MAPSHGYERVNDNPPAVLEEAYPYFLELCRAFGHDVEPRFDAAEDNAKLEKWLEMIISSKKIEITGRGPNYYYARCPFHPPDRNPSFAIHRRKYYAVDYHDGCVFSLKELARELGIRLKDEHREEHQEKKSKRCLLGGEILGGRYLVEVVEADGAPKLLVYDLEAGGLGIHEAFEHDGVAYQPYPDLPFKLPGAPERIDVDPTLWRDTLEFIREYYDNPRGEEVYHVMTAGVAWSYFYRDVKASTPFLLYLGPWWSGKTRTLEVMAALCHRAMAIVDPSEASVFRLIEELRPTLIIDEAQIMDKNVRAIMAAAYRYGMKVPGVIDPEEEGLDGIRWYDVFSFIIYTSREEPPNDIFSRSITIHCEKNTRPTRKMIDEERAKQLRTRWLAQRIRLHGRLKITFDEFASEDGRLQELFSPLLVMAQTFGDETAVQAILRYGRLAEQEIHSMETTSDDALILETMLAAINSGQNDAPEYVTVREIVERLNDGLGREAYTPAYVGRRLSALRFRRKRIHGGHVAYIVDMNYYSGRRPAITWPWAWSWPRGVKDVAFTTSPITFTSFTLASFWLRKPEFRGFRVKVLPSPFKHILLHRIQKARCGRCGRRSGEKGESL